MTRILLTGSTGQVGWELKRSLAPLGELIAPDRNNFDLSRPESLREKIQEWKPDLIVNPAAYTAVDLAETEHELAFKINGDAPRILAEEAEHLQIPLVHYSTDYVFDGTKKTPYTENDSPNPINVYGESKLKGEKFIQQICEHNLIIRTSWVYGHHGHNFFNTMRRLFRERKEVSIVDDQVGAPTWSRMIAETTTIILGKLPHYLTDERIGLGRWGLYHMSAKGETSWYGFAEAILKMERLENTLKLIPVNTRNYPTAANRPMYSGMDSAYLYSVFDVQLPAWDQSLRLLMT